jgi:hypothetical protein
MDNNGPVYQADTEETRAYPRPDSTMWSRHDGAAGRLANAMHTTVHDYDVFADLTEEQGFVDVRLTCESCGGFRALFQGTTREDDDIDEILESGLESAISQGWDIHPVICPSCAETAVTAIDSSFKHALENQTVEIHGNFKGFPRQMGNGEARGRTIHWN